MTILRHLILITASALIWTSLCPANSDKACEDFVGRTLGQMFSTLERSDEFASAELGSLVQTHVDTSSIARFALGKYARRVSADDLKQFSRALTAYFQKTIEENIQEGHGLSADILKSYDRNKRDCVVETVIHHEPLEDIPVLWRVMRSDGEHQVVDIAIKADGNTIWLALELRAQVVTLFERSNGNMNTVIDELGIG